MTLTQKQIPWGAASMLLRSHGDQAKAFADNRIAELSALGDENGVAMWKTIAGCIDQLKATGPRN
ncbi:hypothetical protein [Sphingobium sp. LB126]|uniref:DUF6961 family protein n=1 Tax=Sphingobium sp. LB126 TaxID=1983755 RepID=UPI001F5BEC82|nr:hypothetical protein [Sphingobium sp. LB126]